MPGLSFGQQLTIVNGEISPIDNVHHVFGTVGMSVTLKTINIPNQHFDGFVMLIADSGIGFDTTGNISVSGSLQLNQVGIFVYDSIVGKWFPNLS